MKADTDVKPIKCVVLQLARLGDTLQSLMALRAAKQLYPQLEIHFVARTRFIDAAQRVPWIEKVIPLPTELLVGGVMHQGQSLEDAVPGVARWIAPLVKDEWDLLVNWSYSESSGFLSALIPAKAKLGFNRKNDLTQSCSDDWSCYIPGVVQGGGFQNIHLTDILTTQLLTALQMRFGDPVNAGNEPVTSKGFFSLELDEAEWEWSWRQSSKKWIGIQIGAGQESKTWSPENWALFVKLVLERHPDYHVALLGGFEDKSRAVRFRQELHQWVPHEASTRVLSLVGKTEFDLWASVVGRCQWIIAGDTAVIHLASVLGTRVLNLSLGSVKWAETGPYGNHHYVVTPTVSMRRSEDLSPEAVYAVWSFGLDDWRQKRKLKIEDHFKKLGFESALRGIRIFKSRIRPTGDGGGVVYESLLKRPLQLEDWLSMVTGQVARSWYCGWVAPIGQELTADHFSPELLRELRSLSTGIGTLQKLLEQALYTCTLLAEKSASLKSQRLMPLEDRQAISQLGARLEEIDQLIDRVGKAQDPLVIFPQMVKVLMHNLQGEGMAEISRESVDVYRKVGDGARLFKEWLDKSLKMARPRPVQIVRPEVNLNS